MRKTFLALLLAASVTPAMAQEKNFELKISHWVPASHPLQKALEDWAAAVEKDSGGTIKSKMFPAQQLGKAFDHYDMARDGIADVTYINPGYQPGRFPIIGAGELAIPDVGRQGRLDGARRMVSQICRQGDEGRQVLPRPSSIPRRRSIRAPRRSWCPMTSRA